MNILFICKYNWFRSKVAEVYFNKINRNKNIKAASAGIIEVNKPLTEGESNRNKYLKSKFKISFNTKSRGINSRLLEAQDKIIIVANDVPREIFSHWRICDKVEVWKVPDEKADNKRNINKSVGFIMDRVEKLVEKLGDVK